MNPFILKNIIPKATAGGLAPYLGTETIAWWDPADPTNVTKSGGRFDLVNDKSGNGNHLTNTLSNKPFEGRFINGKEVLDFQGGERLYTGVISGINPWSGVFVWKNDDFTNFKRVFSNIDPINSDNNLFWMLSGNYQIYAGVTLIGPSADANVKIVTLTFNGVNSKIYINGVLGASGDTGNKTITGFNIGSRGNDSAHIDAAIGDFCAYNLITNAQLNQTGQYLADKYAISYTDIV